MPSRWKRTRNKFKDFFHWNSRVSQFQHALSIHLRGGGVEAWRSVTIASFQQSSNSVEVEKKHKLIQLTPLEGRASCNGRKEIVNRVR